MTEQQADVVVDDMGPFERALAGTAVPAAGPQAWHLRQGGGLTEAVLEACAQECLKRGGETDGTDACFRCVLLTSDTAFVRIFTDEERR